MSRSIAGAAALILLVVLLMAFWQPLGQWLTAQIGGTGAALSFPLLAIVAVLGVWAVSWVIKQL